MVSQLLPLVTLIFVVLLIGIAAKAAELYERRASSSSQIHYTMIIDFVGSDTTLHHLFSVRTHLKPLRLGPSPSKFKAIDLSLSSASTAGIDNQHDAGLLKNMVLSNMPPVLLLLATDLLWICFVIKTYFGWKPTHEGWT